MGNSLSTRQNCVDAGGLCGRKQVLSDVWTIPNEDAVGTGGGSQLRKVEIGGFEIDNDRRDGAIRQLFQAPIDRKTGASLKPGALDRPVQLTGEKQVFGK